MTDYAFVDSRMSKKCRDSLEKLGLCTVAVPQNPNLDMPISAHPDISLFCYANTLIVENYAYSEMKGQISADLFGIISNKHLFGENARYPNDCLLNFAVCGKHIIGNMRHISPSIAKVIDKYELIPINVKQGYAKCNICVVNDTAIITEDCGIAKKCRDYGIDVLLLNSHAVQLNGYRNGFIGGASGRFCKNGKNIIMFCGDITKHPEFSQIENFCKRHGAVIQSLSDEPLYDYGSIITV